LITNKPTNMVTISSSFREFLRGKRDQSRIARVLFNGLYRNTHHYGWQFMFTNKDIDYLALRTDGTISYLPAGKEHKLNESGDWARDGRQNGKPSKVIRKIFTKRGLSIFKDTDFEEFANCYKSSCDADKKEFRLLEKDTIVRIYDYDDIADAGTLGGSCMNRKGEYVEFYELFDVQILTMFDDCGKLHGRALVWKLDDGKKFMDRVYVSEDHLYESFIDYARKEGWLWKVRYKSFDEKTKWTDGKEVFVNKRVDIKPVGQNRVIADYYPYVDTFTYGDDLCINNYGGEYEYCNTSGDRDEEEDEDRRECAICGDDFHIDEMVYIERGRYRDEWVHEDNAVHVGRNWYTVRDEGEYIVDVNGDWYEIDGGEVVFVEHRDEWYHCDDVVYSEVDGCDYHRDDCVEYETEDGDSDWCLTEDAVEGEDGVMYHKDNKNIQNA